MGFKLLEVLMQILIKIWMTNKNMIIVFKLNFPIQKGLVPKRIKEKKRSKNLKFCKKKNKRMKKKKIS